MINVRTYKFAYKKSTQQIHALCNTVIGPLIQYCYRAVNYHLSQYKRVI